MAFHHRRWPKISRDATLFFVGACGFLHEVFVSSSDRASIITASVALMGLPVYLRADEHREKRSPRGDRNGA